MGLPELEKKTQPEKPWLGVSFTRDAAGNAEITNVTPGSPAMNAGLDRSDIIIEMDGRTLKLDPLLEVLGKKKPGDTVRIKVRRLRDTLEFTIPLGADPGVTYTLKPVANPTELQTKIYKSWLHIP